MASIAQIVRQITETLSDAVSQVSFPTVPPALFV
jgi:hypothetical protein